ncbi:unnamed protein product [Fraxinus pennsylvanica]|uniref:Uncharacterized protein n=1 Tax=Fraxinus pennsylvanica TaxID=56036 RepID=A0AAD2AGB2_9LAMI|nr:unnamed protein product [Fraxinus pennsylvanica]
MEKNNTQRTPIDTSSAPTKNPDHGQDPPPPAAAYVEGEEEENPETNREPKRRKTLPIALDKQKTSLNSSFSFFCGGGASTPETTPKFGSFNLVVESAKIRRLEKAEDGEEVESTAVEKVVGLSELDSTDGIETVI